MKKRFVFINFKMLIHQFLKNKKRRMIQSSEKLINFLLSIKNELYLTENKYSLDAYVSFHDM